MRHNALPFIAPLLCGICLAADLGKAPLDKKTPVTLTTTAKLAAVDTKISLCQTDPNAIAAEEMKKYDPYIRACGESMRKFLMACKEKWRTERDKLVAIKQIELQEERVILKKQGAVEPNAIVVPKEESVVEGTLK